MLVLDTSALSRLMQADPAALGHAGGHSPGDLAEWLPWTEAASDIYGDQKARLEARGVLIEDMDITVAAIARAHGFGVATCHARHFGSIEGLRVADWSGARRT